MLELDSSWVLGQYAHTALRDSGLNTVYRMGAHFLANLYWLQTTDLHFFLCVHWEISIFF